MIDGQSISFGKLGRISIRIAEDNRKVKRVDWAKSTKGADGKYTEIVYMTHDKYPLFHWRRGASKALRNHNFKPCKGTNGHPANVTQRMWNAWRSDRIIQSNMIKNSDIRIVGYDITGMIIEDYPTTRELSEAKTAHVYKEIMKSLDTYVPVYNLIWKKIQHG